MPDCRSSTWPPANNRSPTRTTRCGSSSTARSTTTSSCGHELEEHGHRFRTHSDTEVIVHAWETWGRDAFARFNGQFAIALWDATAKTLVLARDRLGVRPLYLCEHAGRLWFASEIKALFAADPTIPRALDPVGLAETFTFWSTTPPQTAFVGVTELEPGHVRIIGERGTPGCRLSGSHASRWMRPRPSAEVSRRRRRPSEWSWRTPCACGCCALTSGGQLPLRRPG